MRLSLTNRDIRDIMLGLSTLAQRKLPTIGHELKVAKLTRLISEHYKDTEDARRKAVGRFPMPEGSAANVPPLAITEARDAAYDIYLSEKIELDVPDSLLVTEEMLPRELKSDEANNKGVAQLVALLGPLFKYNDEPKAEAAGGGHD